MKNSWSYFNCPEVESDLFSSVTILHQWLAEQGIDTKKWGVANAKSVKDLWHELKEGDSCLQTDPPLRHVHVAQIIVRREQYVLIETIQEFGTGRQRFRNQPPSEKMKRGETFSEAAVRCLYEELGTSISHVIFDQSTYSEIETTTDSLSYPGLPTKYTFHRIEAIIHGLPKSGFWRDNVSFLEGDPIKRHFWAWQQWKDTLS